jgi:hypothetical protein
MPFTEEDLPTIKSAVITTCKKYNMSNPPVSDLVQDSVLHILENQHKFDETISMSWSSYIYRMSVNHTINKIFESYIAPTSIPPGIVHAGLEDLPQNLGGISVLSNIDKKANTVSIEFNGHNMPLKEVPVDQQLADGLINISSRIYPHMAGIFRTWYYMSDRCPSYMKPLIHQFFHKRHTESQRENRYNL